MIGVSRQPRLILASGSPRRRDLLTEAGFDFVVVPADVDEAAGIAGLAPEQVAETLARRKADVVSRRLRDDVVLAADTVVALGAEILGKPADADDARRMLSRLSGTIHRVITGVTLVHPAGAIVRQSCVISSVQMRPLSPDAIAQYIESGEWQGKAGGYGIQDRDPFVTRTAGCHTNIVGLPMTTTASLLAEAGILPRGSRGSRS